MAALSSKSAQEISDLLDDYGIKHGPIVDSTRSLYVKKLKEAMANEKPAKPSSDKTYYREEREEVTYVHRRVPLRSEEYTDGGRSYMTTTDYGGSGDLRDSGSDREPASYRDSPSYKDFARYRDFPSYKDSAGYRDSPSYKESATYRDSKTESVEPDHRRYPLSYTPSASYGTSSYRELDDESLDQPSQYRSVASQRYLSQSKSAPVQKASSSAATKKESDSSPGRLIPLWLQFLVFLLVAAFLYYVFTSMEAPASNPFKQVEG